MTTASTVCGLHSLNRCHL